MTNKTNAQITEFFNSLDGSLDHFKIGNFIYSEEDLEAIDTTDAFFHISEVLSEKKGAFVVEIIYSSTAIEYLAKNDPSLSESLELAADLGYEIKNLNSKILAILLASQESREQFNALQSEIDAFFAE